MVKKYFTAIIFVVAIVPSLFAQNFGGEIKLKITYNDKPLVGYTITGTINKIDIGGKGVTDSQGNVTLNTEPLPVPNIDVKGVITCGNTNKSWEASGFVYVSPTSDNFYHLKLDKVAEQMSEMSGLPMGAIMESFGLNCPGALGGSGNSEASNDQNTTNQQTNNQTASTSNNIIENKVSNSDVMKKDHDNWLEGNAKKQEERQSESKQFREEFMSNSSPSEGFQNQKNMLLGQISKINLKISKKENDLASTSNIKDKNNLTYDIKELEIERGFKENKLQKVDASIDKGNKPLNKSEKAQYKQKEAQLESALERLKNDRKRGVSIYKEPRVNSVTTETATSVSSNQDEELIVEDNNSSQKKVETEKVEEEVKESALLYSEAQIKNMTKMDLRTYKTDVKSKLTGKKIKYKTKSKFMDLDKKEELARDIKSLEMTIEQLNAEILLRKSEKE